jgi:hypothetical protein
MNAGFNARVYERSAYAMVLLLALVGSIVSLPAAVRASGLECPTTATSSLSIASDSQITRMTTGNDADLANEIDGLIGRARAEAPTASIAETANLLIAAYCPVVAQMTTRSTQEKWQLMRQFDRVLMQQLSATAMPQGSLIVVNVRQLVDRSILKCGSIRAFPLCLMSGPPLSGSARAQANNRCPAAR